MVLYSNVINGNKVRSEASFGQKLPRIVDLSMFVLATPLRSLNTLSPLPLPWRRLRCEVAVEV